MSFPLENARLCMDCDTVFDGALCPSCSSETYFPLSRWVRPALGEIRPAVAAPVSRERLTSRPTVKRTARNASLLLAGSGLAYALWKGFLSKGRGADRVEQIARRDKNAKPPDK